MHKDQKDLEKSLEEAIPFDDVMRQLLRAKPQHKAVPKKVATKKRKITTNE